MTMTSDKLDAEIGNDKQLTSRPFGVDSVPTNVVRHTCQPMSIALE